MNALTNGKVRERAGGGSAGLPFRPPTLSVADTARAARSPPPIANFHPRRHLNESGLTHVVLVAAGAAGGREGTELRGGQQVR